jgi:hypothetical protein
LSNLLIPVELDDPAEGSGMREVGPEDPDYVRLLVWAEDGENPRRLRRATGDEE